MTGMNDKKKKKATRHKLYFPEIQMFPPPELDCKMWSDLIGLGHPGSKVTL